MPDNDANHSRLAALQPLWIKVILMTRLQAAGMTGRLPYLVSTVMPR